MYKWLTMILLVSLVLVACSAPTPRAAMPTPRPDVARYTADQVVDLVKTKLTEGASSGGAIMQVQAATGTATYAGNGLWSVTLQLASLGNNVFTFREATQTVVAGNENAARTMGVLKGRP